MCISHQPSAGKMTPSKYVTRSKYEASPGGKGPSWRSLPHVRLLFLTLGAVPHEPSVAEPEEASTYAPYLHSSPCDGGLNGQTGS